MLTEKATIIDIENSTLWLQTQVKTTCGSCQHKDSCGTSSVAKAFSPKPNVMGIEYDKAQFPEVKIGDIAVIGVAEDFVVKSALYVYLLPILGFIIFALLAEGLINIDMITLTGLAAQGFSTLLAFVGGYVGFVAAKRMLAKMEDGVQPLDNGCEPDKQVQLLQIEAPEIPIKMLVDEFKK